MHVHMVEVNSKLFPDVEGFSFLFKIYTSVETPIQSLSPAKPGHPDSVAPLLPSTEQKGKESDASLQFGDKGDKLVK